MISNKETKQMKNIHVIRSPETSSNELNKSIVNNSLLGNKLIFQLALGDIVDPIPSSFPVIPFEQEKTKKGYYQLQFILKKQVHINADDAILSYPITCIIYGNKMSISEEQFRRMIKWFKSFDQNQSSDESSNSEISDLQSDIIEGQERKNRQRGRPLGSKNKKKPNDSESSSDSSFIDSEDKRDRDRKRRRGRPKGAKNKKKIVYDNIENQSNFHALFRNLFQNRTQEEIKKKLNRSKKKDVKKQQQADDKNKNKIRKKGRPPGAKNRGSKESDSEENVTIKLPPRIKNRKYPQCCSKCANRERKREFFEGKQIPISSLTNLAENLGVEDTENLILNAIRKNLPELLKNLLEYVDKKQNQFIVPWVCAIRLEKASYTIRTRKQYVSKNQREGNNALLQDCFTISEKWWKVIKIERILENIPKYDSGKEIYEILIKKEPQLEEIINDNIPTLIRNGNDTLAYYLLSKIIDKEENSSIYGYSRQHVECLNPQRTELHFKKSSMLKQNCTSNFCSPIHCAVINQKTQLLEYILKHISDYNVGDSLSRKPVHYAAALETIKPMEILLKYGADLKEMDKKKMTPLMLAAQHGSYNIIKFILQKTKDSNYINFKGEEGLSALHFATINKHHQCIQLMLNDPLVDKNTQTKEKFTILHLAAGNGSLDTVRMIIDKGVPITHDCFRRSPLMIALRNHHNDIFFQLLQQSQIITRKDYSNNGLLHYAAAYGNIELVAYLIQVLGSDKNKRNFYPWQLAVLKGHLECAKLLFDQKITFERHLLLSVLKNPRGTEDYLKIIKYLLQTNIYQIDYKNSQTGNTCLHLISGVNESDYLRERRKQSFNVPDSEYEDMQYSIITLLKRHGAKNYIKNEKNQNPVDLCINNENLIGVQLLLKQIPFETENKTNNFIHYLTQLACRGKEEMKFVHEKLAQVDERKLKKELKEAWNGFTFLVYLMKKFTENVRSNFKKNYIKFLNQVDVEERNNPEIQKEQIKKAFQQYVEHEDNLIQLINFLIKNGAEPTSCVRDPKLQNQQENYKGWGIPHFLMKFPSLKLLRVLIKWLDKSFTSPAFEGKTPLHLFCIWNREGCLFNSIHDNLAPVPFIDFVLHEDYQGIKCLQFLLEKGFFSIEMDGNKSTPLLYAVLNGQLNFMNSLRFYGSPMNNCNSLNQVPLIEIIKLKHKFTLEQIQSVLSADSSLNLDIDIRDLDGRNVLHHLVAKAKNFDFSPELCKKLLDYGIQINSKDNYERSPIFYCFIKIESQDSSQEQENNSNDKIQILQTLLHDKDILLDQIDKYERTPLHYACQKNSFFSILYLLDKNINYHIEDKEGNTPLAICLKHRHLNQAALLIKKGVKHGYVNDQGHKYSYFAYASAKLSVGICFMLIDYGYPLQKALEEVKSESFKRVLTKKYL